MRWASGSAPTRPILPILPFLLEDRLTVLPTFAVTLGSPGMWIRAPEFGVDFAKLVHYEQATDLSRAHPLRRPKSCSRARVASVSDGDRAGARSSWSSEKYPMPQKGRPYCTLRQTLLLRGDGGFGGEPPHTSAVDHP